MKWAILAVVLLLTGCTASTPSDVATPTTTPSPAVTAAAVAGLAPVVPATLDATTAETETKRLSDAIEGLIDPSTIVHVDEHAQLVPATSGNSSTPAAGEYYGILRTFTLEQPTNPIELATTIASLMKVSGWTSHESTDAGGISLDALSQDGWFVLVGGDSTVEGQSVLTLQVASPDLP